jgi:hypothetical protein
VAIERVIAAPLPAGATIVVGADLASADQPGPGDKQCIPGQQGNQPAHKGGVCDNP